MRLWVLLGGATVAIGCSQPASRGVDSAQARDIRREVETAFRETYDLSKPGLAERMLALYPKTGRIVSSSGGRVVANRDSIETGIKYFWSSVGANMHDATWIWEKFYIDVLSPTSVVVTATYRVPHKTPSNEPHVIGGAMTSVMEKRGGKWVIVQEHLSDNPAPDTSMAMPMPGHQHP